jgi:hypothetical protein
MPCNGETGAKLHLQGHGNEADFPGFFQKLVPHRSLTLPFEPFDFGFEIAEIFVIKKRLADSPTRRVGESATLRLAEFYFKHSKPDSPTRRVGKSSTPRLTESESQRVVFRLWIFPRIWSQNRNGLQGSVRDLWLWGTNFCKNPENPPHCHVPLSTNSSCSSYKLLSAMLQICIDPKIAGLSVFVKIFKIYTVLRSAYSVYSFLAL